MAQVVLPVITIVIGATIAWVSWLQWRTNNERLKHELFDRRMRVYEAVQSFLSKALQAGTVKNEWHPELLRAWQESKFLFDDQITSRIDEVYKKSLDYHLAESSRRDASSREDRAKFAAIEREIFSWFGEQLTSLGEDFGRFLKLRAR